MGVFVCCRNVASPNIDLTVFPFILHGVSLIGVGTQEHLMSERKVVWDKLARFWKLGQLMKMHAEISLEELNHKIDLILKGQLKEKTIVNIFP